MKYASYFETYKLVNYLSFFLLFLVISLSAAAEPTKAEVAKAVSEKFKGMELETIEMQDYLSDPVFDFYNASGTVRSTENMYYNLGNNDLQNFPNLVKQVIKANEIFPFITVVAVAGSDKDRLIDLQKSKFVFPFYHFVESELDLTQSNLIIVNTPEGMARLAEVRAPYEKDLARIEEIKQLILSNEKSRKDTKQQGYDYWSTVEIDGQKFKNEQQVRRYFTAKINEFKKENSVTKYRKKYDDEVYKPKKEAIYAQVKTYKKEHYKAIDAERKAALEQFETAHDQKLKTLIEERDKTLSGFGAEQDQLAQSARQIQHDIEALKAEKDELERKTDGYSKLMKTAISKGFISE